MIFEKFDCFATHQGPRQKTNIFVKNCEVVAGTYSTETKDVIVCCPIITFLKHSLGYMKLITPSSFHVMVFDHRPSETQWFLYRQRTEVVLVSSLTLLIFWHISDETLCHSLHKRVWFFRGLYRLISGRRFAAFCCSTKTLKQYITLHCYDETFVGH